LVRTGTTSKWFATNPRPNPSIEGTSRRGLRSLAAAPSCQSLGRKYKMNNSVTITIRNVETSDISIFFEQQLDLEANRMAAFVRDDPHDRAAFDAHWKRIMDSTGIVKKTILRGEAVAGHISCYPQEGELEVTYWLGKKHWGKGVATQALKKLLQEI